MKLAYKAYDKTGKVVTDIIDASNSNEATEKLRQQGLFVSEIGTKGSTSNLKRDVRRAKAGGGRLRNIAMFTRQLFVLISTGTPVVQSLYALERQAKDLKWKAIIKDVRTRLEEGSTLAEAMQAHPTSFDTIYRSLIAAGESGGKLDAMLDRLAGLTRQQLKIRSSLIGSLIYPSLLLTVAFGVMIVMITFLLPRFAELYETLDAPLPPTTNLLLTFGEGLRSYWWACIPVIAGMAFAGAMWLKSEQGVRALHTFIVRAPIIGKIAKNFATARLTRVLGVLLEGRVPLLEALELSRDATGNVLYAELVVRCEQTVTRGDNMSNALNNSTLIDPAVTEAIRSGENTGQLGPLLLNVSDFLDEDNENVIRSLMSILEPIILIMLGCLVGLVAVSLFLPLFDLTTMTGTH